MNYSELVAEVYLVTNRPDRASETASAVKSATLKLHNTDFYSKDIYETGVQFATSDFRQSLDYVSLIPNYRALKYFRIVTGATDDAGRFIDIITPTEVLDSYGRTRNDIGYVAGRVLNINSATTFQYALIGAYVNPIVRAEAYSSWIAEQFPYAIIHEAARLVYMATGQLEEAQGQNRLMLEQLKLLTQSALSDVGY